MFNKKETGYREGFDTLVGINTIFSGNIESEGTVRVDGKVKGDLKVSGDVYIGKDALITGSVFAGSVHLSGTVEGNIHSTGVLRLLSTAKLYGDIQVKSFVTDEGALFQGKCSMMDTLPLLEAAPGSEKSVIKKSMKDYKKSAVLDEEKEKNTGLKDDQ